MAKDKIFRLPLTCKRSLILLIEGFYNDTALVNITVEIAREKFSKVIFANCNSKTD